VTVVGFAVAGGRSRRMGRDKALLPWGDTDLVGHALRRLGEACRTTAILSGSLPRFEDRGVSHRFEDRDVPVHADILIDAGPLGGLLTGLAVLEAELGLFLAVDLPLIPVPLLRHLIVLAQDHDAVVPISPTGPEPLCAVYSRACAKPIRARIDQGEYKMTSFWPDVRVRRVESTDLGAFGDPATLFLNVNSPDDYEKALRLRR
jgi:molybdopterin-guanine dinucleotide biosynthesis protein A